MRLLVIGGTEFVGRHLVEAALAWAAWIELSSGICPLTPLENSLRRSAGEVGYSSSFVEHYLVPVVYPPGLTPRIQLGLAVGLVLLNVVLYAFVLRRRGILFRSARSARRCR